MPVVIRVSDESQALIPHVDVSRAIGFIKAKARQLTPIMWREAARRRNNLPNRTFYYAMPGSTISIIELKTNPREQSWHARIIGGIRFGSLIMIPTDDALGDRDQILLQASGRGGPYEVFIEPDLVAGNIDWKGPKTTPGDTFISDVLSWLGPLNRVGPSHSGPTTMSKNVFKNGALYTTAPEDRLVVAAAIQSATLENFDVRRDIIITDVTTTSGGAQSTGVATWRVYVKPEGVDVDPGLFDETTNPTGWKLIATLSAPDDVIGERWLRQRCWFFNRSGTQCSIMLPVFEDTGSGVPLLRRTQIPAVGIIPTIYPMKLRLMSIDIDAFEETAVLNDEGEEPPLIYNIETATVTCNVSAPGPSQIREAKIVDTHTQSGVRRIGVDYKGNTRVFATLQAAPGGGGTNSRSGTKTGPSDYTGEHIADYKFGTSLKVGATEVEVAVTTVLINLITAGSGVVGGGTGGGTTSTIQGTSTNTLFPTQFAKILYCDIREDLVVWSPARVLTQAAATPAGASNISEPASTVIRWFFTGVFAGGNDGLDQLLIQAFISGDLVKEYEEGIANPTTVIPLANFPVAAGTVEGSCLVPPTNNNREFFISFENYTSLDDLNFEIANGLQAIAIATDTARNTAFTVETFAGETHVRAGTPNTWVPGGVDWLNFITGDDLIDVMNQVVYNDGEEPPVDLPPIEAATGHAKPGTIKVI